MAQKIQIRRDTAANWTAANPILAEGEPGHETDTGYVKYGNGSFPWNTLPYMGVGDVGFTQSGTDAVPRTVESKLKDVVSVKDFGAVGNGVADDTLAFQRAFDYVNSIGGGTVYMPPGRYRKADTANSRWSVYSNTTLCGDGDSSVIFFDDRSAVARYGNDLLYCNTVDNITFRDFKIEGTALTELTSTNQKQALAGQNVNGLRVINVTIKAARYMATSFTNCSNVYMAGNRIEHCVRDGLRCVNSSNVVITGNTIKNVSDDAIAVHSADDATLPNSGVIIANNVIEASQGIKLLGAKIANISNNVIRRATRGPVYISIPNAGAEGNSPQFAINISGNIITDTLADKGTNFCILVISKKGRNYGALPTKPGVSSEPFDYNYLNNIDSGSPIYAGQYGVTISNNQVMRTLPSGVNYADWGYGQLFDGAEFSNPAITDATFNTQAVAIEGPIDGLLIQGNYFSGQGGVFFRATASSNTTDYQNAVIHGNVFHDISGSNVGGAVSFDNLSSGSGNGAAIAWIHSNVFDIDPYFKTSTHNADNTWANLDVQAIRTTPRASIIARNNVFKNCAIPYLTAVNSSDNIFYADVVAPLDNAGNKGIRYIHSPSTNLVVAIDGDPASATFNNVTSIPVAQSGSMPTTGKYVKGHEVYTTGGNVAGAPGSQYFVTGWRRLTTGSNHVLNTDWVELRSLTGT